MATQDLFASHTDFNLLSLKDLLLAREHFHLHLIGLLHDFWFDRYSICWVMTP